MKPSRKAYRANLPNDMSERARTTTGMSRAERRRKARAAVREARYELSGYVPPPEVANTAQRPALAAGERLRGPYSPSELMDRAIQRREMRRLGL